MARPDKSLRFDANARGKTRSRSGWRPSKNSVGPTHEIKNFPESGEKERCNFPRRVEKIPRMNYPLCFYYFLLPYRRDLGSRWGTRQESNLSIVGVWLFWKNVLIPADDRLDRNKRRWSLEISGGVIDVLWHPNHLELFEIEKHLCFLTVRNSKI